MRSPLLWLFPLYFLISFGLGYPVLNRYDPTTSYSSDSKQYYLMVEQSPSAADPYFRKRVLLPLIAKGAAAMAKGRIGTWKPTAFGMLAAGSAFTALSACLLVLLGARCVKDPAAGFLASLLFLLNFNVANTHLGAGCIDSGECSMLLSLAYCLLTRRRAWIPAVCIAGALAKETFVPISAAFLLGWLFVETSERRPAALIWTALYLLLGLSTVTLAESAVVGRWTAPWELLTAAKTYPFTIGSLIRPFADHTHLYIWVWLLPLGLPHLKRIAPPLGLASTAAGITAYLLCVWHGSDAAHATALPRELFNAAGPLFSLCAASFLAEHLRPSAVPAVWLE